MDNRLKLKRLLLGILELEDVEQFVDEDFAHSVQARIEEIDAEMQDEKDLRAAIGLNY